MPRFEADYVAVADALMPNAETGYKCNKYIAAAMQVAAVTVHGKVGSHHEM